MTRRHRSFLVSLRSLYQWHKTLGLVTALFVLVLAFTGILLNHTKDFSLDSTYVHNQKILDLYNVKAPAVEESYLSENIWIGRVDGQLFVNNRLTDFSLGKIVAVDSGNGMIFVATETSLSILTADGDLVDHSYTSQGLPGPISGIKLQADNRLLLATNEHTFISDEEWLRWQKATRSRPQENKHAEVPESLKHELLSKSMSHSINLERLILDIHSGRIMGKYGIWVMDFAALFMMVLAISGVIMYLRQRARLKARLRQLEDKHSQ